MNSSDYIHTLELKMEVAHNDSINNDTSMGRACAYARYRAYRECVELYRSRYTKNTKKQ